MISLIIKPFRFYLLSVFLSSIVFAQTIVSDTTLANLYYNKGKFLVTKNEFDSAILYLDSAKKIFEYKNLWQNYIACNSLIASALRQMGNIDSSIILLKNNLLLANQKTINDNVLIAKMMNELSMSYRRIGNTALSLETALESLKILPKFNNTNVTAESYYLLGVIYSDKGEFNLSLKYLELSLNVLKENELIDSSIQSVLGNIFNAMAYVYQQKGDFNNAIEYYRKTIDIKISAFGESHPDLAAAYNNLAAAYFYLDDNFLALEYYLKALSIDQQHKAPDDLSFGYRYNNIAMVYRVNKEYDEAIKYSELAQKIFENKLGSKHSNTAGVLNNAGRIYFDKGDFIKALDLYQKALVVWEEKFGENHPFVAQAFANIGEAFGANGDYDSAIEMLKKSLSIRFSVFGEKHPKVSESYERLGNVYLKMQYYDSALYSYQKSIISLTEGFEDSRIYSNPEPEKILWNNELLSSLALKGNAFELRYSKSTDLNDLLAAYSCFELASRLTDKVRHSFKAEGSKLSFGIKEFSLYEKGINVSLRLFNLTNDEKYKKSAFEFSRESKAGILSDAVAEIKARNFSGIPDTLLNKEKSLQGDLTYFDTQLLNEKQKKEPALDKIKEFEEKYFTLHQQYLSLLESFEKNYPSYYQLKYSNNVVAVELLQKQLGSNSAVLEYFLSDSTLYTFILKESNLEVITVRLNVPLSEMIKEFRQSLQTLNFENYVSSAFSLYKVLIEPVKNNIFQAKNLIIIPDGVLHYLPFEALLTENANKKDLDFSKLSYLLNSFSVSYLPSTAFFREDNDNNKEQLSFAGFAPVFPDDGLNKNQINKLIDTSLIRSTRSVKVNDKVFSSLPESEREVTEISRLFNSKGFANKLFKYDSANEGNLKSEEIAKFSCLHLATHGFINDRFPKLSGLLFSKIIGSNEDGILYSEEIFGLNLKVKLIALSACESGLGNIIRGEGILGLTRALIYAGAENILVSLWQVADKSTSELMIQFYKNVLEGKNFTSSLREAKLKLIKDGIYSYPLEWAPFVLIGN